MVIFGRLSRLGIRMKVWVFLDKKKLGAKLGFDLQLGFFGEIKPNYENPPIHMRSVNNDNCVP